MRIRRIAIYLSVSLALDAQTATVRDATPPPANPHWYGRLETRYQPYSVRDFSLKNSSRLASLIRGGKLYLSLDDAIALAVENNLDVELQRYSYPAADSELLRAQGGGATRGLPLNVGLLPQGIGGPQSPLLNLPATGSTPSSSVPTSLIETGAILPSQTTSSIVGGATASTGPAIPMYDPAITGSLSTQHQSSPLANELVAGTPVLTNNTVNAVAGFNQGFSYGTNVSAAFNSQRLSSNSSRNTFNPYVSSSFGITVTQPLLRGFGRDVNRRYIHIARNEGQIVDLLFRQQAIETVNGVIRLYYDLVSLADDVAVKQQTLSTTHKLYDDNKAKVEEGTLAPIELVRAQAQVAAARQDLANAEGFELQQELILKTLLSRNGTADPLLREARVIPTTMLDVPVQPEPPDAQPFIATALERRPELQQGRLQITNAEIGLKGARNQLLPDIGITGTIQNSGLAGQSNPLNPNPGADPALTGGFGGSLEQLLRHNYPTYAVGVNLNLPIRSRVAEADYIRDQTQLRQSQVRMQQLQNQIRLEVEGANIALIRARAAYEAAVETRSLQEKSLEIEMEKFNNGLSTNFLVMQYQSFVAQAKSTEVAARGTYAKARASLDRAMGTTLEKHNITVDEVHRGTVSRPPSEIPPPPVPGVAR